MTISLTLTGNNNFNSIFEYFTIKMEIKSFVLSMQVSSLTFRYPCNHKRFLNISRDWPLIEESLGGRYICKFLNVFQT